MASLKTSKASSLVRTRTCNLKRWGTTRTKRLERRHLGAQALNHCQTFWKSSNLYGTKQRILPMDQLITLLDREFLYGGNAISLMTTNLFQPTFSKGSAAHIAVTGVYCSDLMIWRRRPLRPQYSGIEVLMELTPQRFWSAVRKEHSGFVTKITGSNVQS